MPNVESASVRAGQQNYLFYNRNDTEYINYFKFTEEARVPTNHKISIKGNESISVGGAITAVYLEKSNEIHVYYIGMTEGDDSVPVLNEVCLKNANSKDASVWTKDGMDFNKKEYEVNKNSLLCSALSINGHPRIFFNGRRKVDDVYYAEFEVLASGGKDWESKKLTGLSS